MFLRRLVYAVLYLVATYYLGMAVAYAGATGWLFKTVASNTYFPKPGEERDAYCQAGVLWQISGGPNRELIIYTLIIGLLLYWALYIPAVMWICSAGTMLWYDFHVRRWRRESR